MRWTLLLEKKSKNSLPRAIACRHLQHIAAAAERNKSLGFKARVGQLGQPETFLEEGREVKHYRVRLRVEECKARTQEVAEERFGRVKQAVEKRARSHGWELVAPQGKGVDEVGPVAIAMPPLTRPPFNPVNLTADLIAREFADVYNRDAHLRLLNDAVQTHVVTNGAIRAHTILFGEPGGCKSTLYERLKPLYDDGHERMVFLDSTTMTKAGLERWILDRVEQQALPEILVFEEMEKCENKDNLMCLGSVMASGYLMRTNAVQGRVQVPARFLVLATCNDEQLLKDFRRGYLWDRFTNQLECPLPDEDTMHRILVDKIRTIPGGKLVWADRAMDLARAMGVRTPRKIIGYLAGRHRLETGDYQRDVLRIARESDATRPTD
jgi:hypothetical protein